MYLSFSTRGKTLSSPILLEQPSKSCCYTRSRFLDPSVALGSYKEISCAAGCRLEILCEGGELGFDSSLEGCPASGFRVSGCFRLQASRRFFWWGLGVRLIKRDFGYPSSRKEDL